MLTLTDHPISSVTNKTKAPGSLTVARGASTQGMTERAESVLVALNELCLHAWKEKGNPLLPYSCVLSAACSHHHGSGVLGIALLVCSLAFGGSWPHSHSTTELHVPLVSLDYTEISDCATGAGIEASSQIWLVLFPATAWAGRCCSWYLLRKTKSYHWALRVESRSDSEPW